MSILKLGPFIGNVVSKIGNSPKSYLRVTGSTIFSIILNLSPIV